MCERSPATMVLVLLCGFSTLLSYALASRVSQDNTLSTLSQFRDIIPDRYQISAVASKLDQPAKLDIFEMGLFPTLGKNDFNSIRTSKDQRNRQNQIYDISKETEDRFKDLEVEKRRKGPTLSVVNPLEVLRQRLMLDMAQRRMKENENQIQANAELLETLGKRSVRRRRSLIGQPGDQLQ